MPDYDSAAVQRELPKMKSALTRAKNKKDWAKVIEVAQNALNRFEVIGYPDCWQSFDREKHDAEFNLVREGKSMFANRW